MALFDSEKVWGRLRQLLSENFEKLRKWPDLDALAEHFRKEVSLIRNTLCRDNFAAFARLQVVRELALESIESADPVSLEDLCGISVEEIAFGRHFAVLFKRTRDASQMDDQDLYEKIQELNRRNPDHGQLYDLFDVPEELRDPGDYDVAVR